MPERTCLACKRVFTARQAEINRGGGKCCSRTCGSTRSLLFRRPPELNAPCALCGKMFHKSASKMLSPKSGLVFCCRAHKDEAQRLGGLREIMPPHYGTSLATGSRSFRSMRQRLGGLKRCSRCGYDKVPGILVVHHVDRNRLNSSPENLVDLCPNCHSEDHYQAKDGWYATSKVGGARGIRTRRFRR